MTIVTSCGGGCGCVSRENKTCIGMPLVRQDNICVECGDEDVLSGETLSRR